MSGTVGEFEVAWTRGEWPSTATSWIPASAGGVHESLMSAGLIDHPYAGLNELELGWVTESTWWYRTTLGPTDGTVRFSRLDTVAQVYLDRQLIGEARNQHRAHEFFLPAAGQRDRELVIRFPPQLANLLETEEARRRAADIQSRHAVVRPGDPPLDEAELALRVCRPQLRKATFSWGWDFAPKVPSLGISGPVFLRAQADVLSNLKVRSSDLDPAARTATLVVTADVSALGGVDAVRVEVQAPGGEVHTAERAVTERLDVRFSLRDVELWWTHDLGTPALYLVTVTALCAGAAVHSSNLRHGFRTLELDRGRDDEGGRLFRFLLNGVPTFVRGANWVPPSMLVGSTSDQDIRSLVELARDGAMTMLRVWGGGVYPSSAFYEACDQLGLLVWQDFMFACFDYPDPTGELAREVRLEAVEQVRRLRHHPSLALWCGENEVQAIHELTHGDAAPGDWGWSLFHELLPSVVAQEDPDTAYWPGSPWAETGLLNGTSDGDRHAWEVWHGNDVGAGGPTAFASRGEAVHFARYEHDDGRFISEFGIHAAPQLSTLQRWTTAGGLALGSEQWLHRIKDTPKDKGWALMGHETGEPSTLQEYVDFSMACQAEGLKHGVEHYRRRQPVCSGTLVWQFNDSWPGLSWSVIDYDLVPKAAYWFLQRAYQPLLASFRTEGDTLELWLSNSGRDAIDLELVVEIGGFGSGAAEIMPLSVVAPPYSSAPVWTSTGVPPADRVAWVSEASGKLPTNRRFFGRIEELPLSGGRVRAAATHTGPGRARVQLTAEGYCYLTRVLCDQPGARFSANYVDLCDGQSLVVDVVDIPPGAGLSVGCFGSDDIRV